MLDISFQIMTENKVQVFPQQIYKMGRKQSRLAYLGVVIVMLSTLIAPPFQRILGSTNWQLLGWTEAQWSLFTGSRALVFLLFTLSAGVLGDFWGRRRTLLVVLFGFIACVLASMIFPLGAISLALQTALSILGIMVRTLTLIMVILILDGRERLQGIVLYTAISGGAFFLVPIISKGLLEYTDIKTLFSLPLLLALIGFWMVTKNIPESRASANVNPHSVGALVAWTFSICAFIFSAVLQGSMGWNHPIVLTGLALGGGILLVLFWLKRISMSKPWKFTLYHQRQLSIVILAGVVINIALYAILIQMYNFFTKIQELSMLNTVLALAPILLGVFFLGVLATRLMLHFGMRRSLSIGLLVLAIPPLGLSILDVNLSYWIMMPFFVLLGFGFILGNTPRLVLLFKTVPEDLVATVQSIGSATAQLGSALAYTFMMTLLESYTGSAYVEMLDSSGLSNEAIAERITKLVTASESLPLTISQNQQVQILQSVEPLLKDAYVTGISQAMLALAGVCVFSAVVVYFGLRDNNALEVDNH
jgi:DHA2 family methylenomycin A resistance protein-like MFS transporter